MWRAVPPSESAVKLLARAREEREKRDTLCIVAVDLPTGMNANTGEVDPGTIHCDMTITLALTVANGGRELAVNSTVKSFHADGVLGGLMQSSVIGPYLTDCLQAKIRDAVNPANLKASFPAGLSQYNPVFKSARFVDLGSGKLGAAIAATFSLDQEQAQKLMGNLKH